ncbi:hypothetical protein QBC32DRAFT_380931 [Pseudoneurospora amorphoporcata]|uniref:Zn(2)-C6 fungal-type domain-containing protein n=1 Tax=Pseudoneurospora amorphoporcata TaxID=241081 RepID=A0AAN6P4X6_9PEZI|nr:hypothetical protein QBC32DRAFT_380931 [Pseudoneurospora amorphoporcata]
MVGVPGKYKGCNSCRVRRVKCDNERPFCRKCIDSGRECLGYERETVFIIGTIEDGGRCSSHPPRVIKSKKAKASTSSRSGGEEEQKENPPPQQKQHQKPQQHYTEELFPDQPLQSAWDDLISLSTTRSGMKYNVQFTALNTQLQNVLRYGSDRRGHDATGEFTVKSMAEYKVPNLQLYFSGQDFELKSQCLISLPESQDEDPYMPSIGSCVFLYDHNNSTLYTNLYSGQPPFKDPAAQNHDPIRRAGPEKFQTFPDHHFFARVYRPNAILTALLNRTPTFLESAEWTSTPWEKHPKSLLDQLFDIIALLPRILSRADRVITEEVPSLPRRQRAQDLLTNCLNIERQLNAWSAFFSAEMTVAISRQTTTAVITPSSSSTSMSDYGQSMSPPYLTAAPTTTAVTSASYPCLSPSSSPYSHSHSQSQHRRSPCNPVSRSRGTPSPTPSASASSPRFQPYPTTSPHSHKPQPRSRRTSPSVSVHPYPYPFINPPLAFPTFQLALAYILYCTSLMQLYQTIERVYWSIFEPDLQNLTMPVQFPAVDLISDPTRYGSKAVSRLAERVGRSLEFALSSGNGNGDGSGVEPGLLAYPLFVVRGFYESLGLGVAMSWEGLGVGMGGGVMGIGVGMGMGVNISMNPGITGGMGMNYSSGMENSNMMDTTTTAAIIMQQQQQPQAQAPPPDGRLEVLWCDHFRERLKAKGAEISNGIMGQGQEHGKKRWREVAAFGY